jgi:hypothetical protein
MSMSIGTGRSPDQRRLERNVEKRLTKRGRLRLKFRSKTRRTPRGIDSVRVEGGKLKGTPRTMLMGHLSSTSRLATSLGARPR